MSDEEIQALANIAIIGSNINIRINSKNPIDYLDRYKIPVEKLAQQYIPTDRGQFRVENYPSFLKNRAEELTKQANDYLLKLSGELARHHGQREQSAESMSLVK